MLWPTATRPCTAQPYDPKGLLNVEEFYVRDLDGYYDSLEMGLHPSYYDSNENGSRSDPDLSPWLDYFCAALGEAAGLVRESITRSFRARHPELLDDPLVDLPDNLRRFRVRGERPLHASRRRPGCGSRAGGRPVSSSRRLPGRRGCTNFE